MKSLAPNTLLQNRYLIVQLIGKGGMGDVYLAVDQRLGSAVALKRTLYTDEELLGQAFEREAKMLARLRHPALTKVSDHFTENDMQYLVMEHISGDDLSKRLEQNQKPFPLSWVLFWADQLLDALNYLHSHEPPIIHRDIKPQNLKLTNENHIILLDFGLAKNSGGETRLSTTGDMVAYTPHYASMEQIRGTGTTARSDIYSLCATIYQLLTNTIPPDALTRADDVLNSLPDPVKPLNELNSEVTVAIANIILKGMSLSAEQRFASAKEMQMALREAYSQTQNKMTAETVAFSTEEIAENLPTPEIKQSGIKTQQFSVPNLSQPVGEKTEIMPISIESVPLENMATNPDLKETSPNPDATLPFVTPLVFNEAGNSSGVAEKTEITPLVGEKTEVMPFDLVPSIGEKTEVMPFDSSPAIGEKTEVMPFDSSPSFGNQTVISPIEYSFPDDDKTETTPVDFSVPVGEKTEVIPIDIADIAVSDQENAFVTGDSFKPQNNAFATGEPFKSQDSFNPNATIPIVSLGEQVSEMPVQETTNFVSVPSNEMRTESFPSEEVTATKVQEEIKPEPKKKAAGGGGGKVFVILGVLAFLGFLVVGAAGVGLYVFKPELFTSASPTPKPTVEPTTQPTIEPTVSPTIELTTSPTTEPTVSPTVSPEPTTSPEDGGKNNVGVDKPPTPQPDKPTPGKTTPTPVKTTPVKTQTPVKVTPTPVKKPTVDTTKILQ